MSLDGCDGDGPFRAQTYVAASLEAQSVDDEVWMRLEACIWNYHVNNISGLGCGKSDEGLLLRYGLPNIGSIP